MDKPSEQSTFKVYEGDRLPSFEQPIAIVTFQKERDDLFFTEFFNLQQDVKVVSRRLVGEGEHIPEYLEMKGVQGLITDAAEDAARELEASIVEKLSADEQRRWVMSVRCDFKEVDPELLAKLWMRGRMLEQLKEVRRITRCFALREGLDRVLALPQIKLTKEQPAKPPPF